MDEFLAPGSLARCIARSEIEGLLHRYCALAHEDAPMDVLASMFTKDGFIRLPNGVVLKGTDIAQITQGNPPKFLRHHLTTIDIQFTSPTQANTESFFFVVTHKSDKDNSGRYKDVIVKGPDGRWQFAERTVLIERFDPDGWFREAFPA